MVSKEVLDTWLNMADPLFISSEGFVYLEKSTTLAKHWQELMALLLKFGLLIVCRLRSFVTKKHFVWCYSKSNLIMILVHNSKKSDLHQITFLVPFSSSFLALSSLLVSCTTRLFEASYPRVRGCRKFTLAQNSVGIVFLFHLFSHLNCKNS